MAYSVRSFFSLNHKGRWLVVGCVVCALCYVLLGAYHNRHVPPPTHTVPAANQHAVKAAVTDLNVGNDRDTDTALLRTVLAHQKNLEAQAHARILADRQQQHDQDVRFMHRVRALDRHWQAQWQSLRQSVTAQVRAQNNRIDALSHAPPSSDTEDEGRYTRVPDLSAGLAPLRKEAYAARARRRAHHRSTVPFIPANATLTGVRLMTALIGEVPVGGHLLAPAFAFKAVVGPGALLAANGHDLPKALHGMVISGYSVGSISLHCVRAYVTRLLWVDNHGQSQVFPQARTVSTATAVYPKATLGYLSDEYGQPCIKGTVNTHTPAIVARLTLLDGLAHITQRWGRLKHVFGAVSGMDATSRTGALGTYLGAMLGQQSGQQALNWYRQRIADVFDAVIVPVTHAPLVFNVTQSIRLASPKANRPVHTPQE